MLKRLFGASTQSTLVDSAFREFTGMLERAAEMHDLAIAAVLDNTPLEVDLDEMDDQIDEAEATIRRAVLEHLSLSPEKDLVASLVLISMVQDAERIGDFARTLGDIPALAGGPRGGPFADELREIDSRIRPLFDVCAEAFANDDPDSANRVVEEHPRIKGDLADYIQRLAASDLGANMAIAYAGAARSLSRVSSHLSNIASSVVQPFHRIRHEDDDV